MLIRTILTSIFGVVDKVVTNVGEKETLKAELMSAVIENESEYVKSAAKIISTEAAGESWLQRNWRPLLMLTIIFIIFNNFVIVPYAAALGWFTVALELPPQLWNLLTIGVGGYIVGRSGEKIVENYTKNKSLGELFNGK